MRDYRDVLCDATSTSLLYQFRVSREMRRYINAVLAARGVAEADVAAGVQVHMLRLLARIPRREIRLAKRSRAMIRTRSTCSTSRGARSRRPGRRPTKTTEQRLSSGRSGRSGRSWSRTCNNGEHAVWAVMARHCCGAASSARTQTTECTHHNVARSRRRRPRTVSRRPSPRTTTRRRRGARLVRHWVQSHR